VKLNAYVLLADPSWLQHSIRSYYPHVDRIIACYDRSGVGWTGRPIPIAECRAKLDALDVDRKVLFLGGDFHEPGIHPMELDTRQRQKALDAAGEGADWVLQFDTDEVLPRWAPFARCLHHAEICNWQSFWYPQRFLFAPIADQWYLELVRQRKRWLRNTTAPGPYAVRAGTSLKHARQDTHDRHLVVTRLVAHRADTVRTRDAVVHFAWVRSPELMQWKSVTSGHSQDLDWSSRLRDWTEAQRDPLRFTLRNLISPGGMGPMRPSYIPSSPRRDSPEWAA